MASIWEIIFKIWFQAKIRVEVLPTQFCPVSCSILYFRGLSISISYYQVSYYWRQNVHSNTFAQLHNYTFIQSHNHTFIQSHNHTFIQSHNHTITQLHNYTITQLQNYIITQLHNHNHSIKTKLNLLTFTSCRDNENRPMVILY